MPTDVCEMPADAPEVDFADFADFALSPAAEEVEMAMATMAVNLIL